MIYLGIDFGTSNSSIVFFDDERKMLEVVSPALPDISELPGGRVYPSVIAFDREGNMIAAGWFAEGHRHAFPNLAVDQVKRWIGKTYKDIYSDFHLENLGYKIIEEDGKAKVKIGRKTHSPEDIVAYLLKHMLEEGKAYLKEKDVDLSGEKVTVIVTHPAYYQQNQVETIRDAVKKMKEQTSGINFEDIKLIPEPMASICAAMYYGKLRKKDRYVMVIDEGAGTLDTMLVDMEQSNIGQKEEIEARGITIGGHVMLGGADMDSHIVDWVLNELKKDENINQERIKNIDKQALRREAESAKIDISEGRTKVAQIRAPGFSKLVELTESQLNTLVIPVVMDCKKTILESLDEIEKKYDEKNKRNIQRVDISKVVLVGGPSRMKVFKDMVNEIIKAEIVEINPMECVAIGAAVSPVVSYKVPADRTYGLLKKENGRYRLIVTVPKDTPLPISVIVPWKVESFESKIPIEVAQVVEESIIGNKKEIVCLTMGKYDFAASTVEKTYFIVFRLSDERKIEVIVTNLENRAEEYLKETMWENVQKEDFKVEFRREIGARTIEDNVIDERDDKFHNPLEEFFFKNAPGLGSRFNVAGDILKESKRIIEFGVKDSDLKDLFPRTTIVENLLGKIMQDINSKLDGIRLESDTISDDMKIEVRQFINDIFRSEDYLMLSIKVDSLDKKVDEIKDYVFYDKYKINNLVKKISDTKTEASAKKQQLRENLSTETINEVESLLNQLDKIQTFLENKSEIPVNSIEGEMYRDGGRKEQMLRSIIDQRLVYEI
jgi:molecular chaperone DnaK (HSP70)